MQFSLNKRQTEAVKHRGGPLLIIAGAGTGKTAVITQRVVDLVKTGDARSSEILALTFTEKAAAEMLERVDIEMPIGYEEAQISTFHSFCDMILKQDGVYIGLDTNFSLMTQAQSYILFRKHLFDFPLKELRPLGNPTQHINHILRLFSRLQDEDVFPEEYINYVSKLPKSTPEEKEFYIQQNELAQTYKMYTEIKIEESKLDFGDLILQTIRLFRERPNILEKYRTKYKHILVDEFQDTNYTQNVLVNILTLGAKPQKATKKDRSKANLTVVGDDDQAIYKFRGAAISNILHFNEVYPDAKKIVLTENYRSRQVILDSAHQLIKHNDPDRLEVTEDISKQLIAKSEFSKDLGDPIRLFAAENAAEEADMVAKQILKLTGNLDKLKHDNSIVQKQYDEEGQGMFIDLEGNNGKQYSFSEISILVRAHSHTDEFVQALKYYGIPYKFGGPRGLYSRPEVLALISFLRLLADYEDDLSMYNILQMEVWGLNGREILELNRMARKKKESIFQFMEGLWGIKLGAVEDSEIRESDGNEIAKEILTESSREQIKKLLLIINDSIKNLQKGWTLGEVLFEFFKESGYLESLLEVEDGETLFKIQNISKYFDMLKVFEQDNPGTTVNDYIDYLKYSIEVGENPSTELDKLEGYDAVNISTVHGAKGLEYPVVFLVSLVSGRFPSRNYKDKLPIPDELVKDYIPEVDEATEHLREERRLFYVGATRAKERLFLTAGKFYGEGKRKNKPSIFLDELLDIKVIEQFEKDSNGKNETPQFSVRVSSVDDSLEISDGVNPTYISYSHIDTYLTCPKKYRYRYILKLPGQPSSALSFGRTIHNSLQVLYTNLKNYHDGLKGFTELPTKDQFVEVYNQKWISEGYDSKRHEQLRKEFGQEKMIEFYDEMFVESQKPIGLEVQFRYRMGDVIMKGSIDRIDLLDDSGEKPVVELIDYKSGKLKDEKEVQDDLQLAIYTLVAEESLGYEVKKASLLFFEHGDKIEISVDEEKKELVKKQVEEVMGKIREGRFEATPGWLCNYCDYSDICADAIVKK